MYDMTWFHILITLYTCIGVYLCIMSGGTNPLSGEKDPRFSRYVWNNHAVELLTIIVFWFPSLLLAIGQAFREFQEDEKMKEEAKPISLLYPCHPGELLREDILPGLDLTMEQAAAKLDYPLDKFKEVLAEQRPVDEELAQKLQIALGFSKSMFLGMQQAFDDSKQRDT